MDLVEHLLQVENAYSNTTTILTAKMHQHKTFLANQVIKQTITFRKVTIRADAIEPTSELKNFASASLFFYAHDKLHIVRMRRWVMTGARHAYSKTIFV